MLSPLTYFHYTQLEEGTHSPGQCHSVCLSVFQHSSAACPHCSPPPTAPALSSSLLFPTTHITLFNAYRTLSFILHFPFSFSLSLSRSLSLSLSPSLSLALFFSLRCKSNSKTTLPEFFLLFVFLLLLTLCRVQAPPEQHHEPADKICRKQTADVRKKSRGIREAHGELLLHLERFSMRRGAKCGGTPAAPYPV